MNKLLNETLLITDPTNIRYLTGFVGVAPEEREAYVLQTPKILYLFTNSLYMEMASKLKEDFRFKNYDLRIIEISREDPLSKKLKEITGSLNIKTLGFEEVSLSYAEFRKLKSELPDIELVPTQNTIEKLREIKRDDEIGLIRNAAKITDTAFDYILGKLKPGVTEQEIAWEIESFFRKNGATNAFSPIVAFGSHSSQPHYAVPDGSSQGATKNQGLALKSTDIVLLDFGARVNGYCSDMTRMVFMGKPTDEWKKAYEAIRQANERALELLAQGVRSGAKLDEAARGEITKTNLPMYPHSLGHAVGLAIHESPRLSYKKDTELKPGMVITIEPGTYLKGQYGIRIEDLILLKEDRIDVLTASPKTLTIL